MATTATIHLWEKQETFRASEAPNCTFQGGAGSGKTRAGCAKALLRALQHPGSRGLIVGASYRSLDRSILPHLHTVAEELGIRESWSWQRAKDYVELPNGSGFWFASADKPESLLGLDLAWAWGDEVGLWKRDAYRYLMGRLRQPGYLHQFFATYTPKGRNWAWEELGTERDGLEIIRASSLENPFVDEEFRARLRREYGEGSTFWRQEVEGHFVAWEGLVYPQFSVERHVAPVPEDLALVSYTAGADWGWSNPGVLLLLGLADDNTLWVLAEHYDTERPVEWWAERACEWHREHRLLAVDCDPSEPANIAKLQAAGLPARRARNEVVPGIAAVASRLQQDTLRIAPGCERLIGELQSYSWKRKADGTLHGDQPEKVHDHAVDALRYGVLGLARPRARAIRKPRGL